MQRSVDKLLAIERYLTAIPVAISLWLSICCGTTKKPSGLNKASRYVRLSDAREELVYIT
jgi:hypothetical protein